MNSNNTLEESDRRLQAFFENRLFKALASINALEEVVEVLKNFTWYCLSLPCESEMSSIQAKTLQMALKEFKEQTGFAF